MNTPPSPHPDPKDLRNLAREKLGKIKTQRILDHCKECPPCADLLLDAVRNQEPRERPPLSRWNWISIVLFAVTLVAVVATMIWFLRTASRSSPFVGEVPLPDLAETVLAETPPTWFEDAFAHAMISPDQRSMLHVGRLGVRLVDLQSGEEERQRLLLDFDQVMAATFDGRGRIARFANRRRDLGWFLEAPESDEMRLTSLPLDSTPSWSTENANVIWTRPPGTRVSVGAPPNDRGVDVEGTVVGLTWSPAGDAAFALVVDAQGHGSLLRVRIGEPEPGLEMIRAGLDASALPNNIAAARGGASVFLALASAGTPDPEARHRPTGTRDLDIYEVDVHSGELRAVVSTPGDDFRPWVAGGHLYWTHNDYSDAVVLVPAGGAAGEALTVVGPGGAYGGAQLPSWSPDGERLAFTRGGWRIADWGLNLDAAVIGIEDDGTATSPPEAIVTGYHEDFTPFWSPDGRWIAYHSHRSEQPVPFYAGPGVVDDIFLRRVDAPMSEEIRLTDFGWEVGNPGWSADGSRLVFDSWDRDGVPTVSRPWIATIDPDTGALIDVEPLALPVGVEGSVSAAWSPVSEEIVLVERLDPERQALWVSSPGGESAAKIVEYESLTYGGVDWTPDGSGLVYSALVAGRMQLFLVLREGGEPRQLTDDSADLLHPQVSPDGRWIAATRMIHRKEIRRLPIR